MAKGEKHKRCHNVQPLPRVILISDPLAFETDTLAGARAGEALIRTLAKICEPRWLQYVESEEGHCSHLAS